MLIDGNKARQELLEAGEDWADKNAAAQLLEDTKSSFLSELIQGIIKADPKCSFAKAESEAKAEPDYQNHINKMVEARRVANKAKVRLDAAKALLEIRLCNAARS